MGWSDIQKQAQDITIYWLGWQLLDLVRLSATGLLVSAAGWVLSQWRNSGWQGEFRGALLALSALTIVLAFLTPRSALPQSGQAGVSHLSTPIQMTTVVTPQPRNEYQNEMDIKETIATAEKLGFLFSQTPNTTLVITAPPENDVFKRDFEALVLAACRWNGKDSCIIEPAPPNLAADLDSGMPESPPNQGIVIHYKSSPDAVNADNYLTPLGCFILHTSSQIPVGIESLNMNKRPNFYWFELGAGSPWGQGKCGG